MRSSMMGYVSATSASGTSLLGPRARLRSPDQLLRYSGRFGSMFLGSTRGRRLGLVVKVHARRGLGFRSWTDKP